MAALIAAAAIGVGLLWFAFVFMRFREGALVDGVYVYDFGDAWGFDLEAYVLAAQRLTTEGSLYAKELIERTFEPGDAGLFYYAPPMGVAMLPIADVPVADSSVGWYVLRIAVLLIACLLMPVKPLVRALAFLAVSFTLWSMKDAILGNVSILLVLPLVVAWRWMDRPLGSIAIAVATSIRPSIGLFLVWQALRRRWHALVWTIGAGLALIALTLPFVGIDGYRDYLAVMTNLQAPSGPSENADLGALAMRLGADEAIVTLVRLVSIGIGLACMALATRRGREIGFMVTLCASLLVVPLLWHMYLLTLIVPVAFLADRLRPAALLLMLASWLPGLLSPFLVLWTIGLLLLTPERVGELRRYDPTVSPGARAAEGASPG